MTNSILSVQILPQGPEGNISIPLIDAAIEEIKASGLSYRVGPLDTVVEGEWQSLLSLINKMNERVLSLGAKQSLFQLKLLHRPSGIASSELTKKHEHPDN